MMSELKDEPAAGPSVYYLYYLSHTTTHDAATGKLSVEYDQPKDTYSHAWQVRWKGKLANLTRLYNFSL